MLSDGALIIPLSDRKAKRRNSALLFLLNQMELIYMAQLM